MNRKEERVSLKTFQEKRLGNIEEIYSKELWVKILVDQKLFYVHTTKNLFGK